MFYLHELHINIVFDKSIYCYIVLQDQIESIMKYEFAQGVKY